MATGTSITSTGNTTLVSTSPPQKPELWSSVPAELCNTIYRHILDDIVSVLIATDDIWAQWFRKVCYEFSPYRAMLLTHHTIHADVKSIVEAEYLPHLQYHVDDTDLLRALVRRFISPCIPGNINPTITIRTRPRLIDAIIIERFMPPIDRLVREFPRVADAAVRAAYAAHFDQYPHVPTVVTGADGSKFEAVLETKRTEERPDKEMFLRVLTFASPGEHGFQRAQYVRDVGPSERETLEKQTATGLIRGLTLDDSPME
ncbi:hypothetical protein LTR86_010587 [Recurvomyces mirabilis]|nr:hypothetical protein LTR86_010587 [Recurvomyces mirabilis]